MLTLAAAASLLSAGSLLPHAASACDTPVYLYAMYHPSWRPAPYEVLYLHHGPIPEADQAVNQRLIAAAESFEASGLLLAGEDGELPQQTNLRFQALDLADGRQASRLPSRFVAQLPENYLQRLPLHVVVSPRGMVLAAERLDIHRISRLVQSPARTAMARLLADGAAGVLVVLTSSQADQTAAAKKTVEETVQLAAIGKIKPKQLAGDELLPAETTESSEKLQVGIVHVARDDPQEEWFVKSLLAVEDDLQELDEPMVFGAYGRGRVAPPYVGKGITPGNLAECVSFMSGACSCEIKDQNPGMDLLTTWSWEAAALAVAERIAEAEAAASAAPALPIPAIPVPMVAARPMESPETGSVVHDSPQSEVVGDVPLPDAAPEDMLPVPQPQGALLRWLGMAGGVAAVLIFGIGWLMLRRGD